MSFNLHDGCACLGLCFCMKLAVIIDTYYKQHNTEKYLTQCISTYYVPIEFNDVWYLSFLIQERSLVTTSRLVALQLYLSKILSTFYYRQFSYTSKTSDTDPHQICHFVSKFQHSDINPIPFQPFSFLVSFALQHFKLSLGFFHDRRPLCSVYSS